jgi:hypothetical protein
MLNQANQEIRDREEIANRLRERAWLAQRPMVLVDRTIAELEELHLQNLRQVPDGFLPELEALSDALPANLRPTYWPRRIRDTIDTCFDIQERLLLGERRFTV